MSSAKRKPNFIFSVSWEVCNKIGGIYTVLSTQAKTLKEESGATLIYVGPDLWEYKHRTRPALLLAAADKSKALYGSQDVTRRAKL